jgi:Asp-tRNA(Asn)/Glu-tRNA(Gln) amidotransferase B subunit
VCVCVCVCVCVLMTALRCLRQHCVHCVRRYFPEPDLPELEITEQQIEQVKVGTV